MQNCKIQKGWSAKVEATLAQLFHMRKAECEYKLKPSKRGRLGQQQVHRMQPK